MNSSRIKRVHKTIDFYQRNFGFHKPYNILIDGTFCKAALEAKLNIKEQLPKYLSSEVNIITTQCIIMEVEKLSKILKNLYGAWLVVKQFPVHKCGHKNNAVSGVKCIKSLIEERNSNRYIIATMDDELREHLRSFVLGAPIIYLHGHTPTIEKPSPASLEFLQKDRASEYEMTTLDDIKKKILGEQETFSKKRRRTHGPNPLSCLTSNKIKSKATRNPLSKKRKRKTNKNPDILASIKNVFGLENT